MTIRELIEAKIAERADELRIDGYHVLVDPTDDQLPPFLRGFSPQILATSPNARIVTVVTTPPLYEAP